MDDLDEEGDGGGGYTRKRGTARSYAEQRVRALPTCGKRGLVAVYRKKGSQRPYLRFLPKTCKSVLCPYCAWRSSKKRLKSIRNLLSVIKEPIAFLTLTFPSYHSPEEAVRVALQVKKRFYNFRLFGKKKWNKVKQRALELLEVYLNNIKDDKEREKKRKFHLWTIQRFEKMWNDQLYNSKSKLYVGRIMRSIWKFEITYNPVTGWHPHWHVLVVGYFPMFVLQAAWTVCGGGPVIDVRAVHSVEDVAEYISKYEAKPVFEVEEQGGERVQLPFETLVSLEASLYGRKLFETWGLSELLLDEKEEEYEFEGVAFGVSCELLIDNLHGVPRLVEELRRARDGPERCMMVLCEAVVSVRVRMDGEVVELQETVKAVLDEEGRIWLVPDGDEWRCRQLVGTIETQVRPRK
ncbi:MAG: protein rep, partial [Candidatus Caldarchaeum sp.]|nr:protein rep [Candidatus Caldarchaeum sp.]